MKGIRIFILVCWLLAGPALSGIDGAAEKIFGVPGRGSTGDAFTTGQGKTWNTTPEWVRQKGGTGTPNPRSGSTGGDFVSGVRETPGYKPGGSVGPGPGVRSATNVYDDWLKTGNKPNVPSGTGVRAPESVPGVSKGSSAGSQWFKNQKNPFIGGSGKGVYRSPTPFKAGQSLTGEAKAVYNSLMKEGFPYRVPPSGLSATKVPSTMPSVTSAGKGRAFTPKSGMGAAGKVLVGVMAINSVVNIATSEDPKAQAKEEGRSWFTGIIGSIAGGLVIGGPVGGFIGAIAAVTVTDPNFANAMMGNDPQDVKDEEVRQALAGLKMLEGGWRSGSEGAGGDIPYGFDQLPSGNETAGGTVDIGPGGVSGRQGQAMAGNPPGWEWAQNVNVSQSYQDGRRTTSNAQGKTGLQNRSLTLSERAAASESDDQQKQTVIASQGKVTAQGISNVQQEGRTAQDTNRIISQTALGTVVAGGLMGGLSSGVATGLEGFFGTVGQGAGTQASVNAGILPPSPSSQGSQTAPGTASSPLNEGGASTDSTASEATVALTGTGKSTITKHTTQNIKMIYTGTVTETSTSTASYGKRGTLNCSHTASITVTLHADGYVTAKQSGDVAPSFDLNGNADSCRPRKDAETYRGSHQNGNVTMKGTSSRVWYSYSGRYTATTLTASGGGKQPWGGIKGISGTTNMTGSMSLKRQ
jgi:hypothetical protein